MKKLFVKCIAIILSGVMIVSSIQFNSKAQQRSQDVNGSFESTDTDLSGDVGKYWDNGTYPVGWKDMWVATAPSAGKISKFSMEQNKENVAEGNNSIHYYSDDNKSRFEIYTMINNIDLSKDYIYRAKIKTDNVAGTGCYLRAQTFPKSGTKLEDISHKDNLKIKGTTDGFTIFEMPISSKRPEAKRLKLEIFFENLSGDVWVDSVELVKTYSMLLDQTFKQAAPGDTFSLTPVFSQTPESMPLIEWTSSQPSIASVASGGAVEAKATGLTTITAKVNEGLSASCVVLVYGEDAESSYENIRLNWSNRLTGNNITNPNDADYIKTMESIDGGAEKAWSEYIQKPSSTDNRSSIFKDLDLTVRFTASSDASKSQPFQTAFDRLKSMSLAYGAKGSKYYKNEDLKLSIIDGLDWMYTKVYNEKYDIENKLYGNWWHWQIGMPQALCDIVIIMYDVLPEDLLQKEIMTIDRFNKNPNIVYKIANYGIMAATSANLMDTSIVSALKSAISGEHLGIGYAQEALSKVLPYVHSGDGFYEDGSCVQHTNLAYTGGYGATLLRGIEKIQFVISDTPWNIKDDNINNVYEWIINGYRPLYNDGALMDMVAGRGIARPSRSDQTTGRSILLPSLILAETAPNNIKNEIKGFVKQQVIDGIRFNPDYFANMAVSDMTAVKNLLGNTMVAATKNRNYHKVFGAMDKVVHHADTFSAGISMYSKRIASFEYGNKENKKGWHMSDGAVYLYNGDQSQYADGFWPTVDPMRLPGITTDHTEGTINDSSWMAHVSNKTFVGGSSMDGKYGATAMDFEIENSSLNGKKSWFSFDDEIVSLGAGISSNEDKLTETIVDNRKIKDDSSNSIIINGEKSALDAGVRQKITNAKWGFLSGNNEDGKDTVGYYFPEPTTIEVLREARTGSYLDINGSLSSSSPDAAPITKNYISLAVNHGNMPKDETYSYVLLPNKTEEQVKAYSNRPNIEILGNTTSIQAVKDIALGVTGMNFFVAGTLAEVTAKQPCSVITSDNNGTYKLAISDPSQTNGMITVEITDKDNYDIVSKDDKITVSKDNTKYIITVDTSQSHGASFQVELKKKDEGNNNNSNNGGNSSGNNNSGSIEENVITLEKKEEKPSKAAALNVASSTYNAVKLKWDKVKDSDGYQIYRSMSKKGTYKKIADIANVEQTYLVDKNLSTGKTYYYKIYNYKIVEGEKVISNPSSIISVTPSIKMSTLKVKKANLTTILISWGKVDGASGYEIYQSTGKSRKYKKVGTINKKNGTSFSNNKLQKNKEYKFKVRAYRLVNSKKVYSKFSPSIYVN